MSALCLVAAGLTARVAATAFTLAWTHTVEQVEWREDWRVEPAALVLVAARVVGSGAGMDPPDGARLEDGAWVWRPMTRAPSITLRRAPEAEARAGDWRLCVAGACRPLGAILAAAAPDAASAARAARADPVRLEPCD